MFAEFDAGLRGWVDSIAERDAVVGSGCVALKTVSRLSVIGSRHSAGMAHSTRSVRAVE